MMARLGVQIHRSSLRKTAAPRPTHACPRPIGETSIGRTGQKYLVLLNGDRNATPSPPLVAASNTPCEQTQRNTYTQARSRLTSSNVATIEMMVATAAAKKMECVRPR